MSDARTSPSPVRHFLSAMREVALIVMGVLIALGADSAWQYRQDRLEEKEILQSIRGEMLGDTLQLQWRILMHRGIDVTVERILADWEAAGSPVTIPDSILIQLFRRPTFQPTLSALEASLASGRFNLIQNPRLREALAGWPRDVADAAEDEIQGRALFETQVLPRLFENTNAVPIQILHAVSNQAQDPDSWVWPGSETEIHVDQEIANHLARRRFFGMEGYKDLELLQARLWAIVAMIDRETQ
ncbi:hypothetical protein ACFL5A_02140 [Gemmatimonadota bacterium]